MAFTVALPPEPHVFRPLTQGRLPLRLHRLNTLRRAFCLAHEAGLVAEVPHFPKLEVNNVRQGFFEEGEFRRVLGHLPAAVAAVAEFGYLSGWRLGEILDLRWLQVDRVAGVIRLGKEIRSFIRAWNEACVAAGCPGRIFHDLRRTAVRGLARAGVPRSIAMKITGHKTEAVYRRYAIVNEADMAEGFQKLAGYLEGRAGR